MKFADIEYLNAPTEPTRINLHIGRGADHEVIRDIPSKAEALRICAERGATLRAMA